MAEATLVLLMLPFEGVGLELGFEVCGPVGSVDDDVLRDALVPDGIGALGGEELRVRSVVERRAFNCII